MYTITMLNIQVLVGAIRKKGVKIRNKDIKLCFFSDNMTTQKIPQDPCLNNQKQIQKKKERKP